MHESSYFGSGFDPDNNDILMPKEWEGFGSKKWKEPSIMNARALIVSMFLIASVLGVVIFNFKFSHLTQPH